MVRLLAACVLMGAGLGGAIGQKISLDHALNQSVTVHFREITVAGVMDFLAQHGIDVAARTSDVNIREKISLNVTNQTMHDVMQAVAEALGARWRRSGNIFVLSHSALASPELGLAGPYSRHRSFGGEPTDDTDPEAAFQEAAETPSAVVNVDGEEVGPRAITSNKRTSLLRLEPSGDWVVAGQWSSFSKIQAHSLRPRLSIGQRKLLAKKGYLSIDDLTAKQVSGLGSIWPDGKYHAISGGHTLFIRP